MAVSFGAERQAAFEHAKTKTTISMWQPNGTIYTFGRDVNIMRRHGIPGNGFQKGNGLGSSPFAPESFDPCDPYGHTFDN